jgi:hypothetical protein
VRFLLGTLLWSAAVVLLFVLLYGAVPAWLGWTLATLAMLLVPSLLTRLLLPALRRIGEEPKWYEIWPGLCAVTALLALLAIPFFARDFTAQKLMNAHTQQRALPAWVHRLSTALAHWLSARVVDPSVPLALSDGGLHTDASTDALRADSAAAGADASVGPMVGAEDANGLQNDSDSALASDAGVDADQDASADGSTVVDARQDATSADVAVEDDVAGEEVEDHSYDSMLGDSVRGDDAGLQNFVGTPSAAGLTLFAQLNNCVRPRAIWMGSLAPGGNDEVVATCEDSVRVFYVQNDSVIERTVFRPQAPTGMMLFIARAIVADIDGDGRRDVAMCAYYTTDRGGTRGGGSWWARATNNGQLMRPQSLVAGLDCAGIEFGDVTGDRRPELVLVREGNGYAPTNPESQMLWYDGPPSRLRQRGSVRLAKGAGGVWLEDLTQDNILDIVVHTGWDGERRNWVIAGARRGPSGVVPNIEEAGTENREFLTPQGRLDQDVEADAVRVGATQQLEFYRSTPYNHPVILQATPALDREEFVLP